MEWLRARVAVVRRSCGARLGLVPVLPGAPHVRAHGRTVRGTHIAEDEIAAPSDGFAQGRAR